MRMPYLFSHLYYIGLTAFHYAVFKGYSDTARTLMSLGSDITLIDNQGRSALHLACTAGSIDIAQWLCSTTDKFDPNKSTSEGMACIHFAALGGHLEILEWLINTYPNISLGSTTNTGMNLIHLACMKGHLEIVQWLVSQPNANTLGLDIKNCDNKKRTPLHFATVQSHEIVVKWLLENGADPRAADADGKTPITLAAGIVANASSSASNLASMNRVKELISNAISPPTPPSVPVLLTKEQAIKLGLLPPSADDTTTPNENNDTTNTTEKSENNDTTEKFPSGLPLPAFGTTPDRIFIQWEAPHQPPAGLPTTEYQVQSAPKWGIGGWKEAVLAAVVIPSTGSTTATTDEKSGSTTPYTYACITGLNPSTAYTFRVRAKNANGWGSYCNGSKDISTLADNASSSSSSKSSSSAANVTSSTDDSNTSNTTVVAPAPPPVPTLSARAVEAVNKNDTALLSSIAEENEDITGFDTNGRTLLHHASNNGNIDTVKWIVNRIIATQSNGSSDNPATVTVPSSIIDARDRVGASAFLLAVVGGHLPIVKYLAMKGASIDTADLKGYTALQYAALKLRMPIFRWLCEAGADASLKNAKGQTARDILDAKLNTPSTPPLSKEDIASVTYMLTIVGNADNLPTPPPPPVYIDASRYVVAVQLPPAKWVAGAPVPYAYELQYSKKLAVFRTSASDSIPTGINIFSDSYLMNLKIGATTNTGDSSTGTDTTNAASNENKEDTPTVENPSTTASTPSATITTASKQVSTGLYTTVYFAITGLSADTRYVAYVRAKSIRGWGPWSKSSEFATKFSTDKYQIPADLLEASNATQMGCNSIAAETSAAAAQGRRPGLTIFHSPSQLLFSSPVVLRKTGAGANDSDLNSAKRSSNALFGTQENTKERRGSNISVDSGVSGEYDALANEAERLGEDAENRNLLLVAAENGRLDILMETSFLRDIRDSIRQRINTSTSINMTSFVDPSVIAKLDPTVTVQYLRDDYGFTLTPEQLYSRMVSSACYCGSLRTVLWLIGYDITTLPNTTDDNNFSLSDIHLTITEAKLFLICSKFLQSEYDGKDLYHFTALGGHIHIFELLLLSESINNNAPTTKISSLKSTILQHTTRTGATPIHLAAFSGKLDCLQWLIDNQESTIQQNDKVHQWNALFYAIAGNHGEVCKYLIDLLTEQSVDIATCRDNQGRTIAHIAASCDASSILGYLENNKLSSLLTSRDNAGMTPLHYACTADARLAIIRLLAYYTKDHKDNLKSYLSSLKDILQRSPEDIVVEATNTGTIASASGTLELLRNWNTNRNVPDIAPAHLTIKREKKSSFAHISWSTSPASFAYSLSGCTALSADTILQSMSTYQKYPLLPSPILNGTAKATGYEIQWIPISNTNIPPSLAFGSIATVTNNASLIPTLHSIMFVADNSVEGNNNMTTITHSIENLPNNISIYLRIRARRSDGTWSRFSEAILG